MYPSMIVSKKNKPKKFKPINSKKNPIALPENIFDVTPLWGLDTFKNRNLDTFIAMGIETMRKETIP